MACVDDAKQYVSWSVLRVVFQSPGIEDRSLMSQTGVPKEPIILSSNAPILEHGRSMGQLEECPLLAAATLPRGNESRKYERYATYQLNAF